MYKDRKVGVVIPALNEALAIAKVVNDLYALKDVQGACVIDEVVVCDNGSSDNTAAIAQASGAVVVNQSTPGYGIACLTAIGALSPCDIVLFVDADDSCTITQALDLLEGIVRGANLVIGSRTLGTIDKGALTPLQRFGNGLSSMLIKALWQHPITDLGPFRAITSSALRQLDMQDKTFGWTVEMQVKAIQLSMITKEVAVDSKVRIGESKISGTLKGSIGAGVGILSMIAKLRANQQKFIQTRLTTVSQGDRPV